MLIFFLAPILLLLLIVMLFTWGGLRLKAEDDHCQHLRQQFLDSGEISFRGRKAYVFILLCFVLILAIAVFGAATSPVDLLALLVVLACVASMIWLVRSERCIRLNRVQIDCYGKSLSWSAVRAADVLSTRSGRYLRLYSEQPVRVAFLFERPRPLLIIHLDAVEHGNALLACVNDQLKGFIGNVGSRY